MQTIDGGYVIAGATTSFGDGCACAWLVKVDSLGNKIWDKTFGAGGTYDSTALSVLGTSDGGFIFTGMKESPKPDYDDVLLIRTDERGEKIWERKYDVRKDDWGLSICQITNGGFAICGWTESVNEIRNRDILLIVVDDAGNEKWNRTFGGDKRDYASSVIETSDGAFLIAGDLDGPACLIKIDEYGNDVWKKYYHSEYSFYSVCRSSDGGYIATGLSVPNNADQCDVFIIKTDANGDEVWNRTFGGSNDDEASCVQQTSDGGYVLIGETRSFGDGTPEAWIIKIDSGGNKIWDRRFDASKVGIPYDGHQTADGGYIVVGKATDNNVGLLKLDSNGYLDVPGGGVENGDENANPPSKLPWFWIAIGAGAVILLAIIIIIIRRRNDDEWDDEDEDEDEDDEEEDDRSILLGKKGKVAPLPQKRCIKCSTVLITPDAAFCAACGSSQTVVSTPAPSPQTINCPGCGGANPYGTAFCGMCGTDLRQSLRTAAAAPMVQQGYGQQQPVSGQFVQQAQAPASQQFVQQPQTQAPVQPMAQQGYVQQQPVPASASMFPPQQQQQNPPAPPPPVPPGYGGLQ